MRALADTLETRNDSNDWAKNLVNYLSNDPEELKLFLGRPLYKHRLPLQREFCAYATLGDRKRASRPNHRKKAR